MAKASFTDVSMNSPFAVRFIGGENAYGLRQSLRRSSRLYPLRYQSRTNPEIKHADGIGLALRAAEIARQEVSSVFSERDTQIAGALTSATMDFRLQNDLRSRHHDDAIIVHTQWALRLLWYDWTTTRAEKS
jgi:hypothetical protein